MSKGPVYTEEEQKLLETLAKQGGSPSALARAFVDELDSARPATAITQKLRKIMLAAPGKATPPERTRLKKAAVARSAGIVAATLPKRRGRPPKQPGTPVAVATVYTNGHTNGHTNEHKSQSAEVVVTLESGLKLVGSKQAVAAALQHVL